MALEGNENGRRDTIVTSRNAATTEDVHGVGGALLRPRYYQLEMLEESLKVCQMHCVPPKNHADRG